MITSTTPAPRGRVRWRLNDLAVEFRQRWTRVHTLAPGTEGSDDERAICGLAIPFNPYDFQWDQWIPDDAPVCQRCERRRGVELPEADDA